LGWTVACHFDAAWVATSAIGAMKGIPGGLILPTRRDLSRPGAAWGGLLLRLRPCTAFLCGLGMVPKMELKINRLEDSLVTPPKGIRHSPVSHTGIGLGLDCSAAKV
jgi:hypothetical protein